MKLAVQRRTTIGSLYDHLGIFSGELNSRLQEENFFYERREKYEKALAANRRHPTFRWVTGQKNYPRKARKPRTKQKNHQQCKNE